MPDFFFLEFFFLVKKTNVPQHFFSFSGEAVTSLSFFNRRLSTPADGGSSTFLFLYEEKWS